MEKGVHDSNKKKTIVIVGLPNTGKSQIFNRLTGDYNIVANYPMTTIDSKRRTFEMDRQTYEVIDTPGLHCLYIHSEEEIAVRNILFSEQPDIIIQCIDANQLKQSLTLTADLLELGIPLVISLNAIDETARKGTWLDSDRLCHLLGVPVVETMAVEGFGINELKNSIREARTGRNKISYGDIIEKGVSDLESIIDGKVPYPRKHSVLLLLDDPFITESIKNNTNEETATKLKKRVEDIHRQFGGNLSRSIVNKRSDWVDTVAEQITRKQKMALEGFSEKFAYLSRHPVFGLPILAFFLIVTFYLVVNVADFLAGLFEGILIEPTVEYISKLVPWEFWNELLVGNYGVLTLGLFNAFITVLPILAVFFLILGLLEDIGYIPNLCVLTQRLFEKIGLSGKATMSLVLGFGCKTMATLTTKGLTSRKEKLIAIYLIAFAIPCAPQLGLDMAVVGSLSPALPAFIIYFLVLVSVEIAAGAVLNKLIKEERRSDFIQELPRIRFPNLKSIIVKTYYRLKWFLVEAIPIFIIAAVVLFALDKTGILDATKYILSPIVVNWLGLPIEMVDVFILSIARHEVAVGMLLSMVNSGSLDYVQSIVAAVITTMFVPCFANIVAMCKETSIKTGVIMAFAINVSSCVLAGILSWILIFLIGR